MATPRDLESLLSKKLMREWWEVSHGGTRYPTEKEMVEHLKKLGCPRKRREKTKELIQQTAAKGLSAISSPAEFTQFFFNLLEWKAQEDIFAKYSSNGYG